MILSRTAKLILLVIAVIYSLAINAAETISSHEKLIQKNNFLVITDIHLNVKTKRSMTINPIGYNSDNDLDKETFTKMLAEINNGIKKYEMAKPKFILLLGDLVGHERTSVKDVYANESLVFKLFKKHFPSTPILYVFGNNDSFGEDYGNFTSDSKEHNNPYRVAKNNGWKNGFLSTGKNCSTNNYSGHFPCIINENKKIGYYSSYISPNLRLIALNSVLFYSKRTDDIAKQYSQTELKWFADQLQAAQNNDESVLIAMHIPPGSNILDHVDFWRDSCNTAFLENIKTYHDNIIGILTGHTHMEELKIIQEQAPENKQKIESEDKNVGLVLSTAGLSTSHGNSPSVKTFYMISKDDQWKLFDYTTFGFDKDKHHNMILKKIYSYRNKYCSKYQGPENSMLECLSSDNINDITANIVKYYTVKNPHFPGIIIAPRDIFINYEL